MKLYQLVNLTTRKEVSKLVLIKPKKSGRKKMLGKIRSNDCAHKCGGNACACACACRN